LLAEVSVYDGLGCRALNPAGELAMPDVTTRNVHHILHIHARKVILENLPLPARPPAFAVVRGSVE